MIKIELLIIIVMITITLENKKNIDIINDKNYILDELKKSEVEKSYSFEESYKDGIDYINNL